MSGVHPPVVRHPAGVADHVVKLLADEVSETRGNSLRIRVYARPDPVTGRPVYLETVRIWGRLSGREPGDSSTPPRCGFRVRGGVPLIRVLV
jgi:hypothetical protein